MLVQEALHSSKKKKEVGMIIKLDMANSFDRVWHSFLYTLLLRFRFDPLFVQTIQACTGGPWITPLVNERPTIFFQDSRGLRQGCTLSPLLYILMEEILNRKLEFERLHGDILGFSFGVGIKPLNHSQFTYDTLLLGGASSRISNFFNSSFTSFY